MGKRFYSRRQTGRGTVEDIMLQGPHAAQVGDDIPAFIQLACRRDEAREALLQDQIDDVKREYYLSHGHEIPPSRLRHEVEEIAYRDVYGVAPADLIAGVMLAGPNKGRKIQGYGGRLNVGGGMVLCAELEDAGNKVLQVGNVERPLLSGAIEDLRRYELASGHTTPQGNTATDRAFTYSWWDTGLYGGTSYLFGPPVLEGLLTLRSREVGWLRPFMNYGIAPGLTYQVKTETNNALRQIMTSASGYTKMSTDVVPVKEGRVGSFFLRRKFGSADLGVRGYHLLSDITAEALMSPEARRVGAWQKTLNDLMIGLGLIDEVDAFLALWYGLTVGYSRQRKASDSSWDVSTLEVPRGKASYIGAAFLNHNLFYGYASGAILEPAASAGDYFKFGSAGAFKQDIYPASGNKVIDLIVAIKHKLAQKHVKCEAVSLPLDMQIKLGLDANMADKTKVFGESDVRFKNEPGFIGTVLHPATGSVSLFAQPEGSIPNDLTTEDSKAVTGVIVAGEIGRAVTEHIFAPASVELSEGMEVVEYDSVSQVIPNKKTVASGRSASAIQPFDLDSVCAVYVVNDAS